MIYLLEISIYTKYLPFTLQGNVVYVALDYKYLQWCKLRAMEKAQYVTVFVKKIVYIFRTGMFDVAWHTVQHLFY